MSKSQRSSGVPSSIRGPLLITIGPQLSGKTSYLKSLNDDITSVSLNETPGLYESIPLHAVLQVWGKDDKESIGKETKTLLSSQNKFHVSKLDLISRHVDKELMLVVLLLQRKTSWSDFRKEINKIIKQPDLFDAYIKVIADIYKSPESNKMVCADLQFYATEAVQSCKEAALSKLKSELKNNSKTICWKNTNLSPEYCKPILQLAMKYQRSVRFIRWGQELPLLPMNELIKRNILNLLKTGRYVETNKLALFYNNAQANYTRQFKEKMLLHSDFAKDSGFYMGPHGLISSQSGSENNLTYPTSLWNECKWRRWTNGTLVTPLMELSISKGISKSRDNEPSVKDRSTWAPVLITIGPNCSGKSTFAKSVDESINFFSVDNDPSLNEHVDVRLVLSAWSNTLTHAQQMKLDSLSDQNGVTMTDRILKLQNSEMMYVTKLFNKEMSLNEFSENVKNCFNSKDLFMAYMKCITKVYQTECDQMTSDTVSIFQVDATKNAAISTIRSIKQAMETNKGMLCWDTSASVKPDFYQSVLKHANKFRRVVRFVRFGQELPEVSFQTLIKRNITTFLRTGRFYDIRLLERSYALSLEINKKAKSHIDFAKLAGYTLDTMGVPVGLNDQGSGSELASAGVPSVSAWAAWSNIGQVFPLIVSKSNSSDSGVAKETAAVFAPKSTGDLQSKSFFAPILITVGPQCCGKSAFAQGLTDAEIPEYSIDNCPGLSEPIPVSLANSIWIGRVTPSQEKVLNGMALIEETSVRDTVKGYLGTEIMYLTLLFNKSLSFESFKQGISKNVFKESKPESLTEYLETVKEAFNHTDAEFTTPTVSLTIPSAIEKSVQAVTRQMKKSIEVEKGLICWSNTNLSPVLYETILRYASNQQRPVRFLRWGQELPELTLKELLVRNLLKFTKTGVLCDFRKLCKFFKAANTMLKQGVKTHSDYAHLAGYKMDRFGRVFKDDQTPEMLPSVRDSQYLLWTNDSLVFKLKDQKAASAGDTEAAASSTAHGTPAQTRPMTTIERMLSPRTSKTEWGPLLVTIGPQCAGKSTFVHNLAENVMEFSIDNVPVLYEQVPVNMLCGIWRNEMSGEDLQILNALPPIFERTIVDRIESYRHSELMYLTFLFKGLIPFSEFEKVVQQITGDDANLQFVYLDVIEELVKEGRQIESALCHIFIQEAVKTAQSTIIDAITEQLHQFKGPICWSNTNLKPEFYTAIMDLAERNQRSVRFIRWNKELPIVDLRELIKRNLERFLKTGKFCDAKKLYKFVSAANYYCERMTGSQNHVEYARAAGFHMDVNGMVYKIDESQPVPKHLPAIPVIKTKWSRWTNFGLVFNMKNMPESVKNSDDIYLSADGSYKSILKKKSFLEMPMSPQHVRFGENKTLEFKTLASNSTEHGSIATEQDGNGEADKSNAGGGSDQSTAQPHQVVALPASPGASTSTRLSTDAQNESTSGNANVIANTNIARRNSHNGDKGNVRQAAAMHKVVTPSQDVSLINRILSQSISHSGSVDDYVQAKTIELRQLSRDSQDSGTLEIVKVANSNSFIAVPHPGIRTTGSSDSADGSIISNISELSGDANDPIPGSKAPTLSQGQTQKQQNIKNTGSGQKKSINSPPTQSPLRGKSPPRGSSSSSSTSSNNNVASTTTPRVPTPTASRKPISVARDEIQEVEKVKDNGTDLPSRSTKELKALFEQRQQQENSPVPSATRKEQLSPSWKSARALSISARINKVQAGMQSEGSDTTNTETRYNELIHKQTKHGRLSSLDLKDLKDLKTVLDKNLDTANFRENSNKDRNEGEGMPSSELPAASSSVTPSKKHDIEESRVPIDQNQEPESSSSTTVLQEGAINASGNKTEHVSEVSNDSNVVAGDATSGLGAKVNGETSKTESASSALPITADTNTTVGEIETTEISTNDSVVVVDAKEECPAPQQHTAQKTVDLQNRREVTIERTSSRTKVMSNVATEQAPEKILGAMSPRNFSLYAQERSKSPEPTRPLADPVQSMCAEDSRVEPITFCENPLSNPGTPEHKKEVKIEAKDTRKQDEDQDQVQDQVQDQENINHSNIESNRSADISDCVSEVSQGTDVPSVGGGSSMSLSGRKYPGRYSDIAHMQSLIPNSGKISGVTLKRLKEKLNSKPCDYCQNKDDKCLYCEEAKKLITKNTSSIPTPTPTPKKSSSIPRSTRTLIKTPAAPPVSSDQSSVRSKASSSLSPKRLASLASLTPERSPPRSSHVRRRSETSPAPFK